jgi:hypothetical protein
MWGVAMRTFLLVIVEVVALFGIPRMIHELRVALGEKAPPVLTVATSTNQRQPVPVSSPPAKAALTDELKKARLLQDSLPPSARTVANLQAVPQVLIPAKESAAHENAAAPRDDDYLPPWMREAGGVKREANAAPSVLVSASAPAAAAVKTPAKQVRHRRHRADNREVYTANPRRTRNRRVSMLGF